MANRVKEVLANAELRQQLRAIGKKAVRKRENTYAARFETILKWFEQ